MVAQKKRLSILASGREEENFIKSSNTPQKADFSTVANLIGQYQELIGKSWNPKSRDGTIWVNLSKILNSQIFLILISLYKWFMHSF